MYILENEIKRTKISDKKIIELYGGGWSINDIVHHHKTNIHHVRNVLREFGINTSNYRATTNYLKECIMAMVASGTSVSRIGYIIDVSPHLIRQVLRNHQINVSDLRTSNTDIRRETSIPEHKWLCFLDLYKSGELGFVKCAEKMGLSVFECVEAMLKLSEDEIKEHKDKLYLYIANQYHTGLSATSVSKQFGVSTAIVKNIFASFYRKNDV